MLIILVILLFALLVINYLWNNKTILAPSVIFTASFLVSCSWALAYQKKWNLVLHWNTFLVVFIGVALFSIIACGVNIMYSHLSPLKVQEKSDDKNDVNISRILLISLIIFQLFTIYFTIHQLRNITPTGSLNDAIYNFRSKSVDPIAVLSLPRFSNYLLLARSITDAAGYYFAFLVAKKWALEKSFNYWYVIIIALSIISSLLLGSRTGTFTLIVCFIVYLQCFLERKNNWISKVNIKSLFAYILMFVLVFVSFQGIATLLGRSVSQLSGGDYLAIYMGAEIKNLDIFLQNGSFPIKTGLWGGQSLIYINKAIANFFNLNNFQLTLDLPYQHVNGFGLGNVYTTFYAYIYDFGYLGIPFLVGIMAFISQTFFEHVKRFKITLGASVTVLIYGRIVTTLALSFFSNKFYEELATIDFVKTIVIWFAFNFIFYIGKRKKS